jgi:hypothetical protein
MFALYGSATFGYDFNVLGPGQRKRMTFPVETSIAKQRGRSPAGGYNSNASAYRMDLIQAVSLAISVVCAVIGLALLPLGGWFLWNGIKNSDWIPVIISILILALATFAFIGAFNVYAHGIIQLSPYMQGHQ